MALIENSKIYSGNDLETIFFRPMLTDKSVQEQGIRVLYNMPVPTVIHMWSAANNILRPYSDGWQGGSSSVKSHKTLEFSQVKAESSISSSDYYSRVYEHIINRADVNLQDLTGTDLEAAETAIFKKAIAEDLRVTTWIGNTSAGRYNTFDGIILKVINAITDEGRDELNFDDVITPETVGVALSLVWDGASEKLKALKREGELAFYVSSDFYQAYESSMYTSEENNNILNGTTSYDTLYYRGIPLVDIGITSDMLINNELGSSVCMLADRRNFVLALNTADYPDAEVRMWYNPDQMENRQRAVFLAAADFIDLDLVSLGRLM